MTDIWSLFLHIEFEWFWPFSVKQLALGDGSKHLFSALRELEFFRNFDKAVYFGGFDGFEVMFDISLLLPHIYRTICQQRFTQIKPLIFDNFLFLLTPLIYSLNFLIQLYNPFLTLINPLLQHIFLTLYRHGILIQQL